ncbi:hypothetical protein ACLB2K_017951 [Fragaria x ananassa]
MDLLGPSLEYLFNLCSRKLSLKTFLMLAADQMINRVEFVHSKSYLHRDIKPHNFLMGLGRRANQLYMIDFGLAKKYRDSTTLQHIPYRENKDLTGTTRYASMNTHLGIEQSRRDDLESLGYVLMYFLKGSLPWQGLKTQKKISEKKVSTSIEELCRGYPTEFSSYFHYCRSLRFAEKPDYFYLKKIFRDLYIREGFQFDHVFDWTNLKYQQSKLATPPSRALGAGTSSGMPHAPSIVDRPIAEEDGRRIPGLNYASVSRQRNSIATDSAITRENNMLSNPNMMGRSIVDHHGDLLFPAVVKDLEEASLNTVFAQTMLVLEQAIEFRVAKQVHRLSHRTPLVPEDLAHKLETMKLPLEASRACS